MTAPVLDRHREAARLALYAATRDPHTSPMGQAEAEAVAQLLADNEAALREELSNDACADALELLWRDVILAHKPDYGPWEYPGQAYRHLRDEFKDLRAEFEACVQALRLVEFVSDGEEGTECAGLCGAWNDSGVGKPHSLDCPIHAALSGPLAKEVPDA